MVKKQNASGEVQSKRGRKKKGEENTSGVFTMRCDPVTEKDIIDYMNTVPKDFTLKKAVRLLMQQERAGFVPVQPVAQPDVNALLLQQLLAQKTVATPVSSPMEEQTSQTVQEQQVLQVEETAETMPKIPSAAKNLLKNNRKQR